MKNLTLVNGLVEMSQNETKEVAGGSIFPIFKLVISGLLDGVKGNTEVDFWLFGYQIF